MATVPRESRLGYFVPFMQAWGDADYPTRQQVEVSAEAYEAQLITGAALIQRVDDLLGLAIPVNAV